MRRSEGDGLLRERGVGPSRPAASDVVPESGRGAGPDHHNDAAEPCGQGVRGRQVDDRFAVDAEWR